MVFNFVDLRSRILSLDGAVSTKNCESDFCQLVIAHERSAKVGLCKTAPAKDGSICFYLRYEQQATSKIWSLYSFEGFLLYIKDIVKITKVTKY